MIKIKRYTSTAVLITASFLAGYACSTTVLKHQLHHMKKVTGIGGIFFKCKDPKAINEWYKAHLGFDTTPYGTSFHWRYAEDNSRNGLTQWNPFPADTKYFAPSDKDFMINYRVQDIEGLVAELRKGNVTILDRIEAFDYGKFVHILDPEGNKIQLWEPAE